MSSKITFQLTEQQPSFKLNVQPGEHLLARTQRLDGFPFEIYSGPQYSKNYLFEEQNIDISRLGFFTGTRFSYSIEDLPRFGDAPDLGRHITFLRKESPASPPLDLEITVVKPFQVALELHEVKEQLKVLTQRVEEAHQLLDSPYMPGCVAGLKECLEQMEKSKQCD